MKKATPGRRVSRSGGKRPPAAKSARESKPSAADVAFDPALPLANTKHEHFVGFVLKGLSQTDAYLAVYGGNRKDAEASGSRLSGNVKVEARLEWLKKQVAEKVQEEVVIDKAAVVKRCLEVLDTPITLVSHAVYKHQRLLLARPDAEGQVADEIEPLTAEEEKALKLAHEMAPSEFGIKVKSMGKMDGLKLLVDVLGLKKADEDANKNGKGIVDGLAALAAAVRARGGNTA